MQMGIADLHRLDEGELREIKIEELLEHYQEDMSWLIDDDDDQEVDE